jgi:hypothetical protein
LKNQEGLASDVHSVRAEQGDPAFSQAALAPLPGSRDQLAKDIIFAVNTSPLRRRESSAESSVHDLDRLRVDSGVVQAEVILFPSM